LMSQAGASVCVSADTNAAWVLTFVQF
jgi:hypothetical protein